MVHIGVDHHKWFSPARYPDRNRQGYRAAADPRAGILESMVSTFRSLARKTSAFQESLRMQNLVKFSTFGHAGHGTGIACIRIDFP